MRRLFPSAEKSADEEHFAVAGNGPLGIGNDPFERIDVFPDIGHRFEFRLRFARIDGLFELRDFLRETFDVFRRGLREQRDARVDVIGQRGAGIGEFRGIRDALRKIHRLRHRERAVRFERDDGFVLFLFDHVAAFEFHFGKDSVILVKLHHLRVAVRFERFERRLEVRETAAFRFGLPIVAITVAVEEHPLVFLDFLLQNALHRGIEIRSRGSQRLDLSNHVVESPGDNRIQRGIRRGAALFAADGAEFEFVPGEGERACAVSVRRVLRERGKHGNADFDFASLLRRGGLSLFELVDDIGELLAEEDGNNRRRSLVRPETVIVPGARHARAEKRRISVDTLDDGDQNGEELRVFVRGLSRGKPILAVRAGDGPVVVLARTVHSVKGLFVQEADQAVTFGDSLENFHREHVVVGGEVLVLEHRGEFELRRAHFVVARFRRDAELPKFLVDFRHKGKDAALDLSEVVVLELLVTRRADTEKRATGLHQVGTLPVKFSIDEEVFLFRSEGRERALVPFHAEKLRDAINLLRQGGLRTEQRGLLVESFAVVAVEHRRNAEDGDAVIVPLDERRAGRIPRRIAAGFESRAKAARREARSVRFALDKFLAAERGDDAALEIRVVKSVVLFGGRARQRLEPVRKVRRAMFDGPRLHPRSDLVRNRRIQRGAGFHRREKALISLVRKILAHGLRIEHQTSEIFLNTHGKLLMVLYSSLLQKPCQGSSWRNSAILARIRKTKPLFCHLFAENIAFMSFCHFARPSLSGFSAKSSGKTKSPSLRTKTSSR